MDNYICIKGKKEPLDPDLSMETAKNKLQGFFEKPKKPKLKHWDYGYHRDGSKRLFLKTDKGLRAIYENGKDANETSTAGAIRDQLYTILGNISSDLERMKEDLKEFEVKASLNEKTIEVGRSIEPNDLIFFGVGIPGKREIMHINLDKATEIHQKLGQVIATAKRKQDG